MRAVPSAPAAAPRRSCCSAACCWRFLFFCSFFLRAFLLGPCSPAGCSCGGGATVGLAVKRGASAATLLRSKRMPRDSNENKSSISWQ